jgi:dTDP-4-dehydrorhamnose reductase
MLGAELSVFLASTDVFFLAETSLTRALTLKGRADCRFQYSGFRWIVYCAAIHDPDRVERDPGSARVLTIDAACAWAALASDLGARFIFLSSTCVFRGHRRRPYESGHKPDAPSPCGRMLAEAESLVRMASPTAVIVRSGWLYGLSGDSFPLALLRAFRARSKNPDSASTPPVSVVWDRIGAPTWSRDVAELIADIADHPSFPPGIVHYAPEGLASVWELACEIRHRALEYGLLTASPPIRPVHSSTLDASSPPRAIRPLSSLLSTHALRRLGPVYIPHWKLSLAYFLMKLSTNPDRDAILDRPAPEGILEW